MLSVLQKLGIVVAIVVLFSFGFAATIYLSLRGPSVTIPEVVGKNRFAAESELHDVGLNFRIRAFRPSRQIKADDVMFQVPAAGEVVKAGQTVAVDVARVPKDGEAAETIATDNPDSNSNANTNSSVNSNENENRPKRNKNANANANANANLNGNANVANGNRNVNAIRANANVRANTNAVDNGNRLPSTNRSPQTENANANPANRNVNRTSTPPRATPTGAPTPPKKR